MRYARPREYASNSRGPVGLLDSVVARFQDRRRTFTEDEALTEIWKEGEDVRLREDPRFWEITGYRHFHLAQHRLANRKLADRLWQGLWDGTDLDAELGQLDSEESGTFHIFCEADPQFQLENSHYVLVARPRIVCPPDTAASFDAVDARLLEEHRALATARTTRELLEMALRIGDVAESGEETLDNFEAWLCKSEDWAEIAPGLWLPADLVPSPSPPKPFRVCAVRGRADEQQSIAEVEIVEEQDESDRDVSNETRVILPEPPVERHLDSSVSWTHTLRAVHTHYGYLPVPTGARFRYPRFVGRSGSVAIHAVLHDGGEQGLLWLDRTHHRFFGDFLREFIEWEEAGRRLKLRWATDAVVITRADIDVDVQEQERRLIDPESLNQLRLGLGESYRQSLADILRQTSGGLTFRRLYELLTGRVEHRPNRASIRAVLSASPEFISRGQAWHWEYRPEAVQRFRRTLVLAALGVDLQNGGLWRFAQAVSGRVRDLVGAELQPKEFISSSRSSSKPRAKILPFRGEQTSPPGTVPLIPLAIAAGNFSEGKETPEPAGWVEVNRPGTIQDLFASHVSGHSMEPLIPDGALCLFRRNPVGSRQGRIVLVQDRRIVDSDTGGSYTVKRYRRVTPIFDDESREHVEIHLFPENPAYKPIILKDLMDEEVRVVAELVEVIEI